MTVKNQKITKDYALYNGDCIEVMGMMPDNSIHLSVYSPPFAGLYQYSSDEHDLSNNDSYEDFFRHYQFVIDEICRVTMPGRMTAVHCMDVGLSNTGRGDSRRDFPGDIIELHCGCNKKSAGDETERLIKLFENGAISIEDFQNKIISIPIDKEYCTASRWERKSGACGHSDWEYVARYDIWKEPLTVRNRTMMKALAHQTIVNDSSKCTNASADYLLVFRKKGENKIPIAHPNGLTEYAGERPIPAELNQYQGWTGKQIENRYSHWIWRQYASAFWDDIRLDRVLPYKRPNGKKLNEEDEKHVHPLQLDVIDRAITLWSNPGEKVLTPFMGVGSETYGAIMNSRMGIGIELKPAYYNQAVKNMADALENQYSALPLFGFAEV